MTSKTSWDRYQASLSDVTPLAPQVELELARAWKAGDQRAGEKLVEASLPFVIRIAREYRRWGVPLEDLVQQGNLGLLKAAEKFDPSRGLRLVTYAVFWIRAEIREYVVRTYRIVRLGTTRTERHAMRSFRRRGADDVDTLVRDSGMPEARARQLLPLLMRGDESLDASRGDQGPAISRLSTEAPSPEELVAERERQSVLTNAVGKALDVLNSREKAIVEGRTLADEPRTLESFGSQFGVSKERVRQIESRAREKLRQALLQTDASAFCEAGVALSF